MVTDIDALASAFEELGEDEAVPPVEPTKKVDDPLVRAFEELEIKDAQPRDVLTSAIPDSDESWNITRGLKSGIYSAGAGFAALYAMGAKAVGADDKAQEMMDEAFTRIKQAEEYQSDTSFKEFWADPSVEGAVDYGMHTLGNLIPSMIVGMGGGAVGGKIATKFATKAATKKLITKEVAKGLTLQAATKKAVQTIAMRGYKTGMVAATIAMEAPQNFIGDVEKHGLDDASVAKALVAAVPSGFVELGLPGLGKYTSGHMRFIEKILGKSTGEVLEEVSDKTLKGITKKLLTATKEASVQAIGEGFQELTQNEFSMLHEMWTATPEDNFKYFTKESMWERAENFAAGVIGGAGMGFVTGALPSRNSALTKAKEAAAKLAGQEFTPKTPVEEAQELYNMYAQAPASAELYKGIAEAMAGKPEVETAFQELAVAGQISKLEKVQIKPEPTGMETPVKVKMFQEKTGKTEEVVVPAKEAITDNERKTSILDKIIKCME